MDVVNRMITTQALLFFYMLVGAVIFRAGVVKTEHRPSLVRLLMDVCIPCMVLHAFDTEYTEDDLRKSVVILVVAVAVCIVSALLGMFLWRNQPQKRRAALRYGTAFSNAGTAGLPVVYLVFGNLGVFYASMYLIPPRIFQWTWGLSLFADTKEKGGWVKNVLLNPVVVVVYIGLAMMIFNFRLPTILGTAMENISSMTAPLSMILIGGTLSTMKPKSLLDKDALCITFIRLLVLPLLAGFVLKLLPVDTLIASVAVTLVAMPVAANTATLAERYDGDVAFASVCVSVSTLLSVVTVPFVTWLIQIV